MSDEKYDASKYILNIAQIISVIASMIIAYFTINISKETAKITKYSGVSNVIVDKYKTDLNNVESFVMTLQKNGARIDLGDMENLPSLYELKNLRDENTAIKNSIELFINEDNSEADNLMFEMKKQCERLDSDLDAAINYRKEFEGTKNEEGRVIRAPLVKTDVPSNGYYNVLLANNKELQKAYIKYSKSEWNLIPSRVNDYLSEFD